MRPDSIRATAVLLALTMVWITSSCKTIQIVDDVGGDATAKNDGAKEEVFLSAGLVAYWTFDEGAGKTLYDSSGNGVDARLSGNPRWVEGKSGNALAFDGIDSFVDTEYNVHLPRFSVSTWVKGAAVPGDDKDTGPVMKQENFLVSWDHRTNAYRAAASVHAKGSWHGAGFGALEANKWYHMVATYDGDSLNAYTDGKLVTSNSAPSGNASVSEQTMKIARHAVTESYFRGTVDETRIYNRALTADEVLQLYDAVQ